MKGVIMIFNIIGVGCGPFNLSLAALLNDDNHKSHLFLEQKQNFSWHSGMQIPFTHIQNSSIRDLVSLVNPQSFYTFNNFLHQTGRMEKHTIAGFEYTTRWEFEQYLAWVADNINGIKMNSTVKKISLEKELFKVTVQSGNNTSDYLSQNISLGMGVTPYIPNCAKKHLGDNIYHNSHYLTHRKNMKGNVVIIGGRQSALEIANDLFNHSDGIKSLSLVYRAPFINQMEDSAFAENTIYTKAGVSQFYQLDTNLKEKLNQQYQLTSDGASRETITELYQNIYINEYNNNSPIAFNMYPNSEFNNLSKNEKQYRLEIRNLNSEKTEELLADIVILATGYYQSFPNHIFSEEIINSIEFDNANRPLLKENYALQFNGKGNIFYLNGARHSHGVVDPNLSLNAVRADIIRHSI